MWLRRFYDARAVLLAVLVLWFATHHFAPTLGMAKHPHAARDDSLRWEAPHSHVQHCDFCMVSGYLGAWQDDLLPRAPKVLAWVDFGLGWFGLRLLPNALARAPPMQVL
jgi:hypothetical protein